MSAGALSAWRRWRPLHDRLAGDVHPDRWAAAGLSSGVVGKLLACRRSASTLSRNPEFLVPDAAGGWNAWDAPADAGGWPLLSGAVLWRTGLRFGAGLFHAEIAKVVLRRDVNALRDAIGEDAHRFAIRQAPALRRRFPSPGALRAGGLGEMVVRSAGLGFGCCLAGLPAGLAWRVLAKLPPLCDGLAGEARSWPVDRREQWAACLTTLLGSAPAPE